MSGGHAIEILSFEVAFATEGQARAQHMRFGDFAAGRGLAVIEEVFDEFAGAAETIQLDELEVDLGETPAAWTETEAEERLREALRRALRDALRPRAAAGEPPRQRPGAEAADLETVWRHLHDGLLPWNLASADRATFEELVQRVVARHGATLAARLRAAPAPARLIARLARQWPRTALAALAEQLGAPAGTLEALAALPPPEDAPEAWEHHLAIVAGTASPGSDAALGLSLDEAGWPRLINGEPAVVRQRLRALARAPADRARLAALLTDARQRQVLSLCASAADVDVLQALFAAPRAWRLGGPRDEAALLPMLRASLLAHVLAAPGDALDIPAAVEALIVARAHADGLAPAPVAGALAAAWSAAGLAAAVQMRLRAALSTRGFHAAADALAVAPPKTPSPPPRTEPTGWRFDVGAAEESEDAPSGDAAWTRRMRLEPAGIADQLRRLGRTAAARRRLARDLTPARLADVLALWTADADLVAAVIAESAPWVLTGHHPTATLAVRLRQWLLDELLTAPPGPRREAAELIAALVRRRAAYDDLPPAAVAEALARAWPTDGPAGAIRTRLREILAEIAGAPLAGEPSVDAGAEAAIRSGVAPSGRPAAVDAGETAGAVGPPADRVPPAVPSADAPDILAAARDAAPASAVAEARAALQSALAALDGAGAVTPLRILLAADRAWLAERLRRSPEAARFAEALAAAAPPAVLFELAQPGLSEPALRLLLAVAPVLPGAAQAILWREVLATAWAVGPDAPPLAAAPLAWRLRRLAGPTAAPALAQRLRAAGAYVRDEPATILASQPDSATAAAVLADWRGRLPERPTAATARAISALLAPAAAGLRALAAFSDAERRDLVLSLRPADAPGALGAVRMLAAAAKAAALAAPPDGWETFGWRAVLRELFEEERPFEAAGFTARWFDAWAAIVPSASAEAARARLVLHLETLSLAQLLAPAETVADHSPPDVLATDDVTTGEGAGVAGRTTRPGTDRVAEEAVPTLPPVDGPVGADPGQTLTAEPSTPPDRRAVSQPSVEARTADSSRPQAPADAAPPAAAGDVPLGDARADRTPATPEPERPTTPLAHGSAPDTSSLHDTEAVGARFPEPTDAKRARAEPERPDTAEPAQRSTPADASPPSAPTAEGGPSVADVSPPSPTAPTAPTGAGPASADAPSRQDADTDARPSPAALAASPAGVPDPLDLAAALRPATPAAAAPSDAAQPDAEGVIYVDNAGLVLTGPFIPMLLNRLELTRAGKFVDDRARERAIHVLQFLAEGAEEPAPEHRLTLNKLICGLDFAIPVGRDVRLEDHERALVDSLLRMMIERWTILGRTSVGGLRETFLMRRGALRPHQEEAWRLTVEPAPFDMLIDRIPWGYGLLKLPWMAQVLHVDWR